MRLNWDEWKFHCINSRAIKSCEGVWLVIFLNLITTIWLRKDYKGLIGFILVEVIIVSKKMILSALYEWWWDMLRSRPGRGERTSNSRYVCLLILRSTKNGRLMECELISKVKPIKTWFTPKLVLEHHWRLGGVEVGNSDTFPDAVSRWSRFLESYIGFACG